MEHREVNGGKRPHAAVARIAGEAVCFTFPWADYAVFICYSKVIITHMFIIIYGISTLE